MLDVVSIPKTNENFRLLYDTKGRFRLHSVRDEEAKVSPLKPLKWFVIPNDLSSLNEIHSFQLWLTHDNLQERFQDMEIDDPLFHMLFYLLYPLYPSSQFYHLEW